MSNVERVFALYVQANPVPEPDLLSPTRDETELLTIEGSTEMDESATDMGDRIDTRPVPQQRRWNPATALAGGFAIVLAIVGAVFLLRGEAGPVAASDANPVVTCDGESCSYDGAESIFEGSVEFTLANNGTKDLMLLVWRFSSATEVTFELDQLAIGADMELEPGDRVPDGYNTLLFEAQVGQREVESIGLLGEYTYLIDVVTTPTEGYHDHAWRVARIEVLEPSS